MLYLTCTTITSVDLAHYGVSHAKDCVSVDCGKSGFVNFQSSLARISLVKRSFEPCIQILCFKTCLLYVSIKYFKSNTCVHNKQNCAVIFVFLCTSMLVVMVVAEREGLLYFKPSA